MSRILDALRRAGLFRAAKPQPQKLNTGGAIVPPNRRKSRRLPLDVPVYVYGYGPGTEPFHEEAHTLNVSANGALLLLSVPVQKGQTLLLTNEITEQEQDCRVVYLGTQHSRTVEAGVAFPETNFDFWHPHAAQENVSAE
jgi:hypothetical protein